MSDDLSLKHDARYMLRGQIPDFFKEYHAGELDAFLGTGREYIIAIFNVPEAP